MVSREGRMEGGRVLIEGRMEGGRWSQEKEGGREVSGLKRRKEGER